MLTTELEISHTPPAATEFSALRASVGWQNPPSEQVVASIAASLYWVQCRKGQQLVACGRVVGDGYMYFYIQDVIVHPDHQGGGLGHIVMDNIEQYLSTHCHSGATAALLAAHGKEAFYQRYGYALRDGQSLGLGMCKFY
ncbi:GNAT family N-acetyltransferase [Pseudoalteromonas rubra]|uniref:GNAT family N-acetyltransferase n=1 Tax=Pseudoalteromonas rubra TaxID=43658 RepID=A0A5S3WL37_9GAMM|nr:GNAT family N-acetyltransferase [Pseudoalteromonas rubra]TMP28402.1 GNAT family N-acetyltransferase [Pseudoalteromonas rubra]TMP37195.1 GNAT family N-acetyltransferase [Pseudoalteromonas rubra]